MSKIIICREKTAETPFVFLNTKVEIYTYEELCFYIYNNTVLISKSTLSEKLFSWIRDELGMTQLAERLFALSNKVSFAQDMLVEILNAGDYYTPEEIKEYVEAWQKYKKLPRLKRYKLKADAYMLARRFIRAATIYDDIIDNEKEIQDKVFLANVYHNRGVAAANNMDTDDARKFFLRAYELVREFVHNHIIIGDFFVGHTSITIEKTSFIHMRLAIQWCIIFTENATAREIVLAYKAAF